MQECVHNQDQSGGWGADEEKEEEEADTEGEGDGEGGEGFAGARERAELREERRVPAKHFWEFCRGRLAVQLYHDVLKLKGGGNVSNVGDLIIPDGGAGMGSSVPGGPGCRGIEGEGFDSRSELGAADSAAKERRKQSASDATRRRASEDAKVEMMKAAVDALVKLQKSDDKEAESPAVPDVAAQLTQATKNAMSAQSELDALPDNCPELVRRAATLALSLRNKELQTLMEKHDPSL